jgi:hypothetical protein
MMVCDRWPAAGEPRMIVIARPLGKGVRDSPNSRAAGRDGEGCRKRRGMSRAAIVYRSVPPRVGRRPLWAAAIRRVGGCYFKRPDQ